MNEAVRSIAEKYLLGPVSKEFSLAYEEALESHDEPIVLMRKDETLHYLNKAALGMARAKSASDILGKPAADSGLPWFSDSFAGASVIDRLEQGESTLFFEVEGRSYLCETVVLRDRLNREIGYLEMVRIAGEWVRSYGIDPLTGIAKKSRFYVETRHLLDRNPSERYAMVYWSVMHFRLIVDVFSPTTGDRMAIVFSCNGMDVLHLYGREGIVREESAEAPAAKVDDTSRKDTAESIETAAEEQAPKEKPAREKKVREKADGETGGLTLQPLAPKVKLLVLGVLLLAAIFDLLYMFSKPKE